MMSTGHLNYTAKYADINDNRVRMRQIAWYCLYFQVQILIFSANTIKYNSHWLTADCSHCRQTCNCDDVLMFCASAFCRMQVPSRAGQTTTMHSTRRCLPPQLRSSSWTNRCAQSVPEPGVRFTCPYVDNTECSVMFVLLHSDCSLEETCRQQRRGITDVRCATSSLCIN